MKLTEQQFELIEAYLNNELSAADRATLEAEMRQHPDWQAELDTQRAIRLGLQGLGIEQSMARARQQYETSLPKPAVQTQTKPFGRQLQLNWRGWAAAASVVLLLGFGYFLYRQQVAQPAEWASFGTESAADLQKSFPDAQTSTVAKEWFRQAMFEYQSGRYDRAIEQLRTIPAQKETIHYRNYFLGLSYLANRQPAEAIPVLEQAYTSPDSTIRQKAEWFLALAFVKNDQKDKARPILQRIGNDAASPFQKTARQVLQKI